MKGNKLLKNMTGLALVVRKKSCVKHDMQSSNNVYPPRPTMIKINIGAMLPYLFRGCAKNDYDKVALAKNKRLNAR